MLPSLTCDIRISAAPALLLLLLPGATTGGATATKALDAISSDMSPPAGNPWYAASKAAAELCTHSPDCGPLGAAALFFLRGTAAARPGERGPRATAGDAGATQRGERLSSDGHGRHAAT